MEFRLKTLEITDSAVGLQLQCFIFHHNFSYEFFCVLGSDMKTCCKELNMKTESEKLSDG